MLIKTLSDGIILYRSETERIANKKKTDTRRMEDNMSVKKRMLLLLILPLVSMRDDFMTIYGEEVVKPEEESVLPAA